MPPGTRLGAWLVGLSPRERTLLVGAAVLTGSIAAAVAASALRDDLATLRARVASHERELGEVRRLAASLHRQGAPVVAGGDDGVSLLAALESAASGVVGRERIASMTPSTTPAENGLVEERVTLRVADASLAEVVHLLHALEGGSPACGVTHLELRKHPDDPSRFAATLEAARLRGAP